MDSTFGIDLGGTSIRIGLYDAQMQLVSTRSFATLPEAGPQAAVHTMSACISSIRSECGVLEDVAIGIGSPGPINLREGVLGLLPNLPGWEGFPLRHALREATNMPVFLESDANAAAIAEWKLGAGLSSELTSMAMITLGTGVGSGLIFHGRVWHGHFGMGGELGHATIFPGGRLCGCGSYGCLEMYASASAVVRTMHELLSTNEVGSTDVAAWPSSAEEVALLASTGQPQALKAYRTVGAALGIGIANLINTLDLPLIVVGGGVAKAWDLFSPAMFQAIEDNSVVYRLKKPKHRSKLEVDCTHITHAALGSPAGLLGAALLPRIEV